MVVELVVDGVVDGVVVTWTVLSAVLLVPFPVGKKTVGMLIVVAVPVPRGSASMLSITMVSPAS